MYGMDTKDDYNTGQAYKKKGFRTLLGYVDHC